MIEPIVLSKPQQKRICEALRIGDEAMRYAMSTSVVFSPGEVSTVTVRFALTLETLPEILRAIGEPKSC